MTTPSPRLAIVVARGRNGVIGADGDLPWRLPADLAWFKRVTMGKPLLMGRKTWESLPGLLPGRPHLVLSRDPDYRAEGAETFSDWDAWLARGRDLAAQGEGEVMIVGGGAIYQAALALADRLYITDVDAAPEGDTVFPALDPADWDEVDRREHAADERHAHAFVIRTLDRIRGA